MSIFQASRTRKRRHRTNPIIYGLQLGFFAGLIGGIFRRVLYMIHFTKVLPGFLAEPFFRNAFLKTFWGNVIGIGSFIIFSIVATYLYRLLLGRFRGPWPGLLYGAFWWAAFFLFIGPVFGLFEPARLIGYNTLSTEFSMFLVWGLFIGYSWSFEFHDEASREPVGSAAGRVV